MNTALKTGNSIDDELEACQSRHNSLTGLPDRQLFSEILSVAIDQAKSKKQKLAVVLLELDRFRKINNSLGHAAGDKLLEAVAKRLKAATRNKDNIAHLYGNEFAILMPQIENRDNVIIILKRILESFKSALLLEGYEFFVTFSTGIGIYPDDGYEPETLMKKVDAAMYKAKKLGGNNFKFCKSEMNAKSFEKVMLGNRLYRALKQNEFLLHYQPQVDLQTWKITGVEALIRWNCPGLGFIPPIEFIPVVEESGLIGPISEWVLKTACKQNQAFNKNGLLPLKVAVNLSAYQFQQENLFEIILQVLKDTALDPNLLDLELTESAVMGSAAEAIETLSKIKSIGISLSIDDFGTGYSSLSYLKHFPIDVLKIDRSFIQYLSTNKKDAAIVKTIIALGHSLNFKVIAEGVEKKEQLEFLRKNNCDSIQGYYISPPIPAEQFLKFIRNHSAPF